MVSGAAIASGARKHCSLKSIDEPYYAFVEDGLGGVGNSKHLTAFGQLYYSKYGVSMLFYCSGLQM